MREAKRHSIRLNSGGFWDFLAPEKSQFVIEDIAHNLSKEARFNGATDGDLAYSVAQHEVNASYIVTPGLEFEALHHDDAEFAYKDITTWLKRLIPDYRLLLQEGENVLADWHGIQRDEHPLVKLADLQMLKMEKYALFQSNASWSDGGFHHLQHIDVTGLEAKVDLKPWTPRKAKRLWLKRHFQLLEKRNARLG